MSKPEATNLFPTEIGELISQQRQPTPMKYPVILGKRVLLSIGLLVSVFCLNVDAQQRRPGSTPAPTPAAKSAAKIKDIRDCPDEGIGGDPGLNRRKNVRIDNKRPTLRSIQWMKDLPNPKTFTRQNRNRAELARLGEGRKIAVVAYALVARKGSKETCNCHLSAAKDTDNHIVLVDPKLKKPTVATSEADSITAEFTPRVRLDHPNFSRSKLQPLITGQGGKLLVRVTGQLMFDSEHFLGHHLERHNDWEIHPVFKLEYCPKTAVCRETTNANWVSLDNN